MAQHVYTHAELQAKIRNESAKRLAQAPKAPAKPETSTYAAKHRSGN